MSKKFEKIVNAPHRAFGNATRNIRKMQPDSKLGQVARVTGMGLTGLTQFLLWAAKYITLDNHLTRAGERAFGSIKVNKNKSGHDKKLQAFAKKYPNLSSHILYYMMLAMVAGGVLPDYSDDNQQDNDENKIENVIVNSDKDVVISDNTYGSFVKKMEPLIDPFIAYLILPEAIHKNDAGLHTPYNSRDGKITIGYGSTKTPDGKPVTMRTPPITDAQARDWVRQHLYSETFPLMYAYSVMYPDVKIDTPQDALFIMSLLYNTASQLIEVGGSRTFDMTNLVETYGDRLTPQHVADLFMEKPVSKLTGFGKLWLKNTPVKDLDKELSKWVYSNGRVARGLYVRRFVELGIGLGRLTPQQCLDCAAGIVYGYGREVGYNSKYAFFDKKGNVNLNTYTDLSTYLLERSQTQDKIRNFLPPQMIQNIESGTAYQEFARLTDEYKAAHVEVDNTVAQLQRDAQSAFDDGNFIKAAQLFASLTYKCPDVASYHNDLAVTYNNLGRYDDAISQVNEIINRIRDAKQYAAAYYNAGVAYEKKGNLQKALANYKLSVAKGNRSVQKDVTRVNNLLKKGSRQKQKRISFNAGRDNIQNSFIRKLGIQNNNTNGMA
ncbi:MAG: tetratricopeptide repeat protein [Alphaproteobacteria bacterium]|nr:tetratricopeptide repeat protein [Alphaproteobacteria bacterium]